MRERDTHPVPASAAIQILPQPGGADALPLIDRVIAYIRSFGLPTQVGPFETAVEGDYDTLLEIIGGCAPLCVEAGAAGALVYVKLNYRPGGVLTMEEKTGKYREVAP